VCVLAAQVGAETEDIEPRLRKARESLDAGRLDRADKEIVRVLAESPGSADAHRLLCEIRRVQGRRDEAVAACRSAADLAPSRADLRLELGDLLAQRDDGVDEALRSYRSAAEADPNNPRPHVSMGSLYERRGRLREAEAEYREALALNPNVVQANAGLGAVLFTTGRLAEARGYLSRAIELRPRDLRSHVFLGLSLNHEGQLDLALQELRAAATIDPHSANAAAGVQEQMPRFEHLRATFALQIESNPRDASLWHNVAVISYYLRDYESAWKHLVRAQQLGYPVDLGFKEVVYARWRRLGDR